jgi:hypothetical protein
LQFQTLNALACWTSCGSKPARRIGTGDSNDCFCVVPRARVALNNDLIESKNNGFAPAAALDVVGETKKV